MQVIGGQALPASGPHKNPLGPRHQPLIQPNQLLATSLTTGSLQAVHVAVEDVLSPSQQHLMIFACVDTIQEK